MSMLPPILVELKASSAEFMAKMGEARREVTKLGTESSGHMQKFAAVGKAALIGVAVGAVAIGAESVKMASDFQSSMELIRTQAGASQSEVNSMSKAVLSLAGQTATAPEVLSEGLYHLESSGLRGAKALEALKVAAEGAKVGHADLESVTNALNAVIASGVKGASNMSGAMGMLNATVGAGDMRMQDLADAMGTGVLTVAKNFGVSLKDVGAALAVFGDNNIRGADAATKLSQAITYMEKPAASAGKVFKTFGMTTKELRDDISKGGLGLALKDLHEHLTKAGITGTKVGPVLLDAFGRKPAGAINTLLGQFARFQSKQEEVGRGAKNFGADWKATTQTFHFQMEQLKTSVEALAIRIGIALIPVIQRAATVTAEIVQWFQKHAEVAKILAVAVGSVLVVAMADYAITAGIAAAATIAATWPMLLMVAAVAAVGVGLFELATHWSTVWNGIKRVTEAVWHAISNTVSSLWHRTVDDVMTGVHAVVGAAKTVANFFTKDIPAAFRATLQAGRDLVAWIVDKLLGAFGDIVHGAADAFGWVPGIGGKLKAAARHFDEFRDNVNAAIRGINTNVTLHVDAVLSAKANAALHNAAPLTIGHAYADGTNYAAGGLSLVGERGPELMDVPRGARIYPHGTGPSGGGGELHVHFDGPVYGADADELALSVRNSLLRLGGRNGATGLVA